MSPSNTALLTVACMLAGPCLMPRSARASACCMSATAYGVGRLKPWEKSAFGLSLGVANVLGAWDYAGSYSDIGAARSQEWRSTLWAMERIQRRGSMWLRVPLRLGFRSAAGVTKELHTIAAGLGDIDAGIRWDWVPVGAEMPAIATSVTLRAPVGTPPVQAHDPLGADIAGRGAWVITLATTVERTHVPWFVRGAVGVSLPLPTWVDRRGVWQRFGPALQGSVMAGRQLVDGVVLSAALATTWESALIVDGHAVADSMALTTTATLALSTQVADAWTVQAAVSATPTFTAAGRNREAIAAVTLGLRYGYAP